MLTLDDDTLMQIGLLPGLSVANLRRTCKRFRTLFADVGYIVLHMTRLPTQMHSLTLYNGTGFWQAQKIYLTGGNCNCLRVLFFFIVDSQNDMRLASVDITTPLFSVYNTNVGVLASRPDKYDVQLPGAGSIMRLVNQNIYIKKQCFVRLLEKIVKKQAVICFDVPSCFCH
jgi:hypothetical protein